jgi:hypothetical protein
MREELMRRTSPIAFASIVVALGCSSSGSGVTAPADTGAEASEYATFNCGGANPVNATLRFQDIDNLRNLDGVTVTSPACPGVSATTQENGVLLYTFPKDQPVTARLSKPGYFTVVTEEVKFLADGADGTTFLFADKHKELLTDYAATNAYAIVALFRPDGDAGACDAGGVKIEVKGNPSVKVAYASQNTPPLIDPALTATKTGSGVAVVGPLPAGTVEIIGTKAGCTVTNSSGKYDTFTGKIIVEPGSLTYVALDIKP